MLLGRSEPIGEYARREVLESLGEVQLGHTTIVTGRTASGPRSTFPVLQGQGFADDGSWTGAVRSGGRRWPAGFSGDGGPAVDPKWPPSAPRSCRGTFIGSTRRVLSGALLADSAPVRRFPALGNETGARCVHPPARQINADTELERHLLVCCLAAGKELGGLEWDEKFAGDLRSLILLRLVGSPAR